MKKGKLFELLENDITEDNTNEIKNFIIMNGKTKPYCPVTFAQVEIDKTIQELRENGYGYLLDK